MRRRWACGYLLLLFALACAASRSQAEATRVLGNGRLTLGLDDAGGLLHCRWPAPTHGDFVVGDPALALYIEVGGAYTALLPAPMEAATNDGAVLQSWSNTDATSLVESSLVVLPEQDVLSLELRVQRMEAGASLVLVTRLAPPAPPIPELDADAVARISGREFGTLIAADTALRFFPAELSADLALRCEALLNGGHDRAHLNRLPDGVWMGMRAGTAGSWNILPATGDISAEMAWDSRTPVFGPCRLAFKVPAPVAGEALRVLVAFAVDASSCEGLLDTAQALPYISSEVAKGGASKDLHSLMRLMPAGGGAPAAGFSPGGRGAIQARPAAWAMLALDAAGEKAAALGVLQGLCLAIRADTATDLPVGALPWAFLADGSAVGPRYIEDANAVAWLLGGAWHFWQAHASDTQMRRAYLALWPKLAQATEYLVAWTLGRQGAPYPSYAPVEGRDVANARSNLLAYMGLQSARALAESLDRRVPATWLQRLEGVEVLLRMEHLAGGAPSPLDPSLAFFLDGILPKEHPLRGARFAFADATHSLAELQGILLNGTPPAETGLCEALAVRILRGVAP